MINWQNYFSEGEILDSWHREAKRQVEERQSLGWLRTNNPDEYWRLQEERDERRWARGARDQ